MRYYKIRPEVAGHVGKKSIVDRRTHPPVVTRLHYEFDGWLGGDILESFPCYIVTERLRRSLVELGVSGCEFDEVLVTTSSTFRQIYPEKELPAFYWLKATGRAGVDDFGMSLDHVLVVSSRVLDRLKAFQLSDCEVTSFG